MKKITVLLFILLSVATFSAFSQELFTIENFEKTFKTEINKLNNKALNKEYKKFAELWETTYAGYQQDIIDVLNIMHKKGLFAQYVYSYLLTLDAFEQQPDRLPEFSTFTISFISGKPNRLKPFLVKTRQFIGDSIINYNGQTYVKVEYSNYDLEEKNGQILLKFPGNNDFYFISGKDTLILKIQNAVYNYESHILLAQHARLNWQASEELTNKVSVDIPQLKLDLNKGLHEIPNVKCSISLPYLQVQNKNGTLTIDGSTPKLTLNEPVEVKNIFPQTDYKGNLSLNGNTFVLDGDFTVSRQDSISTYKFIRISCDNALLTGHQLQADKSQVNITLHRHGQKLGEITHNSASVSFVSDTNIINRFYAAYANKFKNYMLSIKREASNYSNAPFLDTYHKMALYVDEILWFYGDTLYFWTNSTNVTREAKFASFNYFEPGIMDYFITPDYNNTALMLYRYWRTYGKPDTIFLDDFNAYLRDLGISMSMYTLDTYISRMENIGFLKYSIPENSQSYVSDLSPLFFINVKAYLRYITPKDPKKKDNIYKMQDFDDILIINAIHSPNEKNGGQHFNVQYNYATGSPGKISLSDLKMKINNPQKFYFSKPRKVLAKSIDKYLTIDKNRQITFKGELIAGLAEITGQFTFYYDSFMVDIPQIDIMTIKYFAQVDTFITVKRGDTLMEFSYKDLQKLESEFNNFSAKLYIDTIVDKSGSLDFINTQYPYLVTTQRSTIKYSNVVEDVSSDSVYMKTDNFVFKDLCYLTQKHIKLTGSLHTPMLPTLDSLELKISDGKILGFEKEFDSTQAIEVYGSGKLQGKLALSDEGLISKGVLDFQTMHVEGSFKLNKNISGTAEKIIIKPADQTDLAKQHLKSTYPSMVMIDPAVKNNFTFFVDDSTQEKTIKIKPQVYKAYENFNNSHPAILRGELTYTEKGVAANGTFELKNKDGYLLKMKSPEIKLKYNTVAIDQVDSLILKTDKEKIEGTNFNVYLDMEKKTGEYTTNQKQQLRFNTMNYTAQLNKFKLDLDKFNIDLGSSQSASQNYNNTTDTLVLTNNYSDIQFITKEAHFYAKPNTIAMQKVEKIKVYHTYVVPQDTIAFQSDGTIEEIKNATVLVGNQKIYNATLNFDQKAYSGSGKYMYGPSEIPVDFEFTDTVLWGASELEKQINVTPHFALLPQEDNKQILINFNSGEITASGRISPIVEMTNKNCQMISDTVNIEILKQPVTYSDDVVFETIEPLYLGPAYTDTVKFIYFKSDETAFYPAGKKLKYSKQLGQFIVSDQLGAKSDDSLETYSSLSPQCYFEAIGRLNLDIKPQIYAYSMQWIRSKTIQEGSYKFKKAVINFSLNPKKSESMLWYIDKAFETRNSNLVEEDRSQAYFKVFLNMCQTKEQRMALLNEGKIPVNQDAALLTIGGIDLVMQYDSTEKAPYLTSPKQKSSFYLYHVGKKDKFATVYGYFRIYLNGNFAILYIEDEDYNNFGEGFRALLKIDDEKIYYAPGQTNIINIKVENEQGKNEQTQDTSTVYNPDSLKKKRISFIKQIQIQLKKLTQKNSEGQPEIIRSDAKVEKFIKYYNITE